MNGPNPELMHLYGTDAYYLEKTGALPLGLRLLGGAASLALWKADKKHQEELLAEAALMNQMMRMEEAAHMEGVAAGFEGGGLQARAARPTPSSTQPLDIQYPVDPVMAQFERQAEMERTASVEPGLAKLAAGIGAALAQRAAEEEQYAEFMEKMASGEEFTELEKEAFLNLIRKGVGAVTGAVKGVGGKVGGMFKRGPKVPGATKPPAVAGGARAAAPPRPAAPKPTTAAAGGPYRTGAQPAAVPQPKVTPGATQQGFTAGKPQTAQSPWAAQGQASLDAKARQAPARKTSGPSGDYTPATPQTAAQRNVSRGSEQMLQQADDAAAAAAKKAAQPAPRKPLLSWKTKAKLGLGAAGVATAYAGYKGMQAARDYMMVPTYGGGQYGTYGRPATIQHQVNPYGYVPTQY